MILLLVVALTYVLSVLQTTVCPAIALYGAAPDLLVLEATLIVLWGQGPWRVAGAGAVGLVHDLMSSGRLGGGTFAFVLWAFLLAKLQQKVFTEHPVAQSIFVAVGTTLVLGLIGASRGLLGELGLSWPDLLAVVGRCALLTAAVALPVAMCHGRRRRRGIGAIAAL